MARAASTRQNAATRASTEKMRSMAVVEKPGSRSGRELTARAATTA
jgi:hypothetical protein